MITNFFLGANSSAGFRSLYDGFTDPGGLHDLMVLKGGPGVGKSSLMKYIGRQAEAQGEDVEYIWCSGDPDSLDGVRLPRIGVAVVDGTSPHGVAPLGHNSWSRRVDLSRIKNSNPASCYYFVIRAVKTRTAPSQTAYFAEILTDKDTLCWAFLGETWKREARLCHRQATPVFFIKLT